MLCRHGEQDWCGSPPECAFTEDGRFTGDNWNCALMNALRELVSPYREEPFPYGECYWDNDYYMGIIYIPTPEDSLDIYEPHPLSNAIVILEWYKTRGRTNKFKIVKGYEVRDGTEEDALFLAEYFKDYHDYDVESLKAGK